MKRVYRDKRTTVYHGDAAKLDKLADASIDAIVSDPPYGLEFMGKEWDSFGREGARSNAVAGTSAPGIGARDTEWPSFLGGINPRCRACGHSQRGGSPCTCPAADFTDERGPRLRAFQMWCEAWAIEALRVLKPGGYLVAFGGTRTWHRLACAIEDAGFEIRDSIAWMYGSGFPKSHDVSKAIDKAAGAARAVVGQAPGARNGNGRNVDYGAFGSAADGTYSVTTPATDEAKRWDGWGTALKPGHEPIILARKPLAGTVAATVLAHGTGGINIDGCRVGTDSTCRINTTEMGYHGGNLAPVYATGSTAGRWPTNVVLSHVPTLDERGEPDGDACADGCVAGCPVAELDGQSGIRPGGGASRFFPTFRYQAKAPTKERVKVDGVAHPTVKPLALMRWLIRLVTPPDGMVLDPFAGSGTTVEAARLEGFRSIAIEREPSYLPLIEARIERSAA